MRVHAVQVSNFRSVVDSEPVEITDRVTVFIGKNEQGKTTFLRGLLSFNPQSRYSSADLPNHLREQLEEADPTGIPMVKVWLTLEAADLRRLLELMPSVRVAEEIAVTKYFDGHYAYATTHGPREQEQPLEFAVPSIKPYSDVLIKEARL
jgi:ABC-type cobalamin/Fe3+-siderophores transport system ATPase subunit